MHEHNKNENSGMNGMMLMMLVCCLIPVLILFGGTKLLSSIGYGWVGFLLIGGFILFHFRRVLISHGTDKNDGEEIKDKTDHKNCCH